MICAVSCYNCCVMVEMLCLASSTFDSLCTGVENVSGFGPSEDSPTAGKSCVSVLVGVDKT